MSDDLIGFDSVEDANRYWLAKFTRQSEGLLVLQRKHAQALNALWQIGEMHHKNFQHDGAFVSCDEDLCCSERDLIRRLE